MDSSLRSAAPRRVAVSKQSPFATLREARRVIGSEDVLARSALLRCLLGRSLWPHVAERSRALNDR